MLGRVSTTPVPPTSLRQRKKDRLRQTVISVSRRLFDEQGYDATTLEQICSEVEISVPTLLAHFESKERLALASEYESLTRFRAAVTAPDRATDTLSLWRRQVEQGATAVEAIRAEYLRHLAFLESSPVLMRGSLALLQQYEEVLAEGFARDFGTDARTDLATRLMATTLSYGNNTVLRQWYEEDGRSDLRENVVAVVDFVIENFPRPGVALTA